MADSPPQLPNLTNVVAVVELAVSLYKFVNIELHSQGWYAVRIKVQQDANITYASPQQVLDSEIGEKPPENQAGYIDSRTNSYVTPIFRIRYCLEEILLGQTVSFQLHVSNLKDLESVGCVLEYELLFMETDVNNPNSIPKEFKLKPVARDAVLLQRVATSLHHYYGCNFTVEYMGLAMTGIFSHLAGFTTQATVSRGMQRGCGMFRPFSKGGLRRLLSSADGSSSSRTSSQHAQHAPLQGMASGDWSALNIPLQVELEAAVDAPVKKASGIKPDDLEDLPLQRLVHLFNFLVVLQQQSQQLLHSFMQSAPSDCYAPQTFDILLRLVGGKETAPASSAVGAAVTSSPTSGDVSSPRSANGTLPYISTVLSRTFSNTVSRLSGSLGSPTHKTDPKLAPLARNSPHAVALDTGPGSGSLHRLANSSQQISHEHSAPADVSSAHARNADEHTTAQKTTSGPQPVAESGAESTSAAAGLDAEASATQVHIDDMAMVSAANLTIKAKPAASRLKESGAAGSLSALRGSPRVLNLIQSSQHKATKVSKGTGHVSIMEYFNSLGPTYSTQEAVAKLVKILNRACADAHADWEVLLWVLKATPLALFRHLKAQWESEQPSQVVHWIADTSSSETRSSNGSRAEADCGPAGKLRASLCKNMPDPWPRVARMSFWGSVGEQPLLLLDASLASHWSPQQSIEQAAHMTGSPRDNVHAVIFVHGFAGAATDLCLVRAHLSMMYPFLECFASKVNEGTTFDSIEDMGARLAEELFEFLQPFTTIGARRQLKQISFVGHSIGNLILRSALTHPSMAKFKPYLWMYLSICGPHLGFLYSTNSLLDTGVSVLKKFGKAKVLHQLSFTDAAKLSDCYLCKLATDSPLSQFKHVILVASPQDRYVPFNSARISMCDAARKDSKRSVVYQEMMGTLLADTGGPSGTHLYRIDVDFDLKNRGPSFSKLLGRTAHIEFIENDEYVRMMMWGVVHKYKLITPDVTASWLLP